MTVRFRVLGTIEAFVDGQAVDLGHALQRCVLGALLADANRPVSTDQLAERVWADRPPHRAHRSLASYLSRLRKALAGAGDVEIGRQASGYVLRVDPDAVDLHRFRSLLARARSGGDPAGYDEVLLDEALDLWRGDAFADIDTPWCATMRQTLEAERLAAELDRTDLALCLGSHNSVLPEVSARAAAHPLDERMAAQLMLALYRAGRQADSLDHYQRTRRRLADEFGADPGAELRELHQRILTADAGLDVVQPCLPAPRLPPEHRTSRQTPVPRQLPAPPRCFVGRDREMAAVTDVVEVRGETMPVATIIGPGGIGKSSLALRWAHQNIDRFPDGQLYVNLRGFDPSGTPMPPMVAVRGFLDALGVAPSAIPVDEDGQVALYRSLVADRKLLILLDNARDSAQVGSLLPGTESCAVLVTSRNRLAGLGVLGAGPVGLDLFAETSARELLARHLGKSRVEAESGAVDELVRWCAGLPLAVGIVASRAAAEPGFPLEILAKELRDTNARLDALDAGDLNASVRTVLSWSRDALEPEVAQAFVLLGMAPGPDIGLPGAAALAGLDRPSARVVLRTLVGAHLLQEHVPGRYRIHDLVRLSVSELADDAAREIACERLTGYYLGTAEAAARVLRPGRSPEAGGPVAFKNRTAALAWFDAEHTCLLSALKKGVEFGVHTAVYSIADALTAFHVVRGHLREDVTVWQAALDAAQLIGKPVSLAKAHLGLGTAYARVGEYTDAFDHLRASLALAGQADSVGLLADVHRALGWLWDQRNSPRRALPHAHRSLRLYRAGHDKMSEADALNSAGRLYARLGRPERGAWFCEQALLLARRYRHQRAEAVTLDSLGCIAQQAGEHAKALGYYRSALELVHETAGAYDEAGIQANLGDAYHKLGNVGESRLAWNRALELYSAQHRTRNATAVRLRLQDPAVAPSGWMSIAL
ncbi:AfsR/SARP family transcriptional regulator [Amycolatopsis pittospori]|uniref:AfsR/SARP family transcriptional regulator n=1 Tax=Amycolatopsis pittospori TaxID=2749434 RepID=UPI0015F03EDF|nr:BTAD domain-containing putative transcriptional regulator [Amycolatopsis pittospori]